MLYENEIDVLILNIEFDTITVYNVTSSVDILEIELSVLPEEITGNIVRDTLLLEASV